MPEKLETSCNVSDVQKYFCSRCKSQAQDTRLTIPSPVFLSVMLLLLVCFEVKSPLFLLSWHAAGSVAQDDVELTKIHRPPPGPRVPKLKTCPITPDFGGLTLNDPHSIYFKYKLREDDVYILQVIKIQFG